MSALLPLLLLVLTGAVSSLSDTFLGTMELSERRGYRCEEHRVVTEDGYVLTVHRIPRGRSDTSAPGPPVLLQHGVFSSSDLWVMTQPSKSLAFTLADHGYDVWLGNVRGNFYSRHHLNMSADRPAFWDFSFHELGVLDLAAMLDLVLSTNGAPQLYYVGHSMGNSMFLALTSLRPSYNERVRLAVMLAPAIFLGHIRLPALRLLLPHRRTLSRLLDEAGATELFSRSPLVQRLAEQMCSDSSPAQPLCIALFVLTYGDDLQQLNKTELPVYVSHLISGGSKKTLAHFAQIAATGDFEQYDYGAAGNLQRYGLREAPSYPLHQVTAPCYLVYGEGDLLLTRSDVMQLKKRLPRVAGVFQVPHPQFTHIDFIVARDADKLYYHHVLDLMAKF